MDHGLGDTQESMKSMELALGPKVQIRRLSLHLSKKPLSREREEPRQPSMQESEAIHEEGHKWSDISQGRKEVGPSPTSSASKSSSIKYFKCLGKEHIASQCHNRRNVVLRENGEVESESSQEDTSCTSGEESFNEGSHYEGLSHGEETYEQFNWKRN
ncbi:hypothetical protein CR513_16027, partial [Mucuna pruriens]